MLCALKRGASASRDFADVLRAEMDRKIVREGKKVISADQK